MSGIAVALKERIVRFFERRAVRKGVRCQIEGCDRPGERWADDAFRCHEHLETIR